MEKKKVMHEHMLRKKESCIPRGKLQCIPESAVETFCDSNQIGSDGTCIDGAWKFKREGGEWEFAPEIGENPKRYYISEQYVSDPLLSARGYFVTGLLLICFGVGLGAITLLLFTDFDLISIWQTEAIDIVMIITILVLICIFTMGWVVTTKLTYKYSKKGH